MRDNVKPERLPYRPDQPGNRGCDLIFRPADPGRERLPDRRAELSHSFGEPLDEVIRALWTARKP